MGSRSVVKTAVITSRPVSIARKAQLAASLSRVNSLLPQTLSALQQTNIAKFLLTRPTLGPIAIKRLGYSRLAQIGAIRNPVVIDQLGLKRSLLPRLYDGYQDISALKGKFDKFKKLALAYKSEDVPGGLIGGILPVESVAFMKDEANINTLIGEMLWASVQAENISGFSDFDSQRKIDCMMQACGSHTPQGFSTKKDGQEYVIEFVLARANEEKTGRSDYPSIRWFSEAPVEERRLFTKCADKETLEDNDNFRICLRKNYRFLIVAENETQIYQYKSRLSYPGAFEFQTHI